MPGWVKSPRTFGALGASPDDPVDPPPVKLSPNERAVWYDLHAEGDAETLESMNRSALGASVRSLGVIRSARSSRG